MSKLYCAFKLDDSINAMVRHAMQRVEGLQPLETTPVDRIHVTTAFLGEIPLEQGADVLRACADELQFYCRVGGPGTFTGVLYLTVESVGAHRLRTLQAEAYGKVCGRRLWPAQYVPHVTVAKRAEGDKRDPKAALALGSKMIHDINPGSCLVTHIGLYTKSDCLYEIPLRRESGS